MKDIAEYLGDTNMVEKIYDEAEKFNNILMKAVGLEESVDFTLPGYNYLGPGTKIVSNMLKDIEPVDYLDEIAYEHDWEYFRANTVKDIETADNKFTDKTKLLNDPMAKISNWVINLKPKGINSKFINELSPEERSLIEKYRQQLTD